MEEMKTTNCDSDAIAREILADLAGGSVNDSTNSLVQKIIFGGRNDGKTGAKVSDVDTMIDNFTELVHLRLAIKHKDFDTAKKMMGGKVAKYLNDETTAKCLSNAVKIALNSAYGGTATMEETREVYLDVTEDVKEKIKEHIEKQKGQPFGKLESYVAGWITAGDGSKSCICCTFNAFTDLHEVKVDLGDMGDVTINTGISWGEVPVIYTSSTTEHAKRAKRYPINFCPFCGRKLRNKDILPQYEGAWVKDEQVAD